MTDLELKLYQQFQCAPTFLGKAGHPNSEGKRAKVSRIYRGFFLYAPVCQRPEQVVQAIRKEWTAGLSPIAAWFMWFAIRTLVVQVVRWLWREYTPGEGFTGSGYT